MKLLSTLVVALLPLLGCLLDVVNANPLEPNVGSQDITLKPEYQRPLKSRAVSPLSCNQWKWGTGGGLHCCKGIDKSRGLFSIGVNCQPVPKKTGNWSVYCPKGAKFDVTKKDFPLYCCSKVKTVNGLVCHQVDHLPKGWWVPPKPRLVGPCFFKVDCPNGGRGGDPDWGKDP